jgi:hypothetical protein
LITQQRQKVVEATPEEHIARLELAKAKLVSRKTELQRKIDELEGKRLGESKSS